MEKEGTERAPTNWPDLEAELSGMIGAHGLENIVELAIALERHFYDEIIVGMLESLKSIKAHEDELSKTSVGLAVLARVGAAIDYADVGIAYARDAGYTA